MATPKSRKKFKFQVAGEDNVCVFPKEIMDHFQLEDGELVDADFWPGGRVVMHVCRRTDKAESLVGLLRGRIKVLDQPPTIEDINDTIAEGWAGRL